MNMFKKVLDFFLCFLREDCEYSIKKLLVYLFSAVSVYIIIFTDKDYYEILAFVAILLGIRTYERLKTPKPTDNPSDGPLLAKKRTD